MKVLGKNAMAILAVCSSMLLLSASGAQALAAATASSARTPMVTPRGQVAERTEAERAVAERTVRVAYKLFVSSQGYQMHVLSGFTASAEEPGRDVVMDKSHGEDYMRIQKLALPIHLAAEKKNMRLELRSVGSPKVVPASVITSFSPQWTVLSEYRAAGHGVHKTIYLLKHATVGQHAAYFRIAVTTAGVNQSAYLSMVRSISPLVGKASTDGSQSAIVAGSLEPKLRNLGENANGEAVFEYVVKNQTEQVQALTFNTTERYDYTMSKNGQQIAQYSDGRMFGQVVTTTKLVQGGDLHYMLTLGVLSKGNYSLTVWLTSSNQSVHRLTTDFSIS